MRPLYCGNLDRDVNESELERLFSRYGKVVKVKIKSGFAFIFMEDERDANDAIRGLDRSEFGRRGRRLQVEWSKQEHSSRSSGSTKPTNTLFIVNFDPVNTKKRDLERHFGEYGKIIDIRMRNEFAFIQFESTEDAIDALEATNLRFDLCMYNGHCRTISRAPSELPLASNLSWIGGWFLASYWTTLSSTSSASTPPLDPLYPSCTHASSTLPSLAGPVAPTQFSPSLAEPALPVVPLPGIAALTIPGPSAAPLSDPDFTRTPPADPTSSTLP